MKTISRYIIFLALISCDMKTEPVQKPPSPGEKTITPTAEITTEKQQYKTGNVIFIHPDGSGANMWGAMRLLKVGPDGETNWDKMDHIGLYRSHQVNSTNSSSQAGATVHAYGVKVPYDTYGIHPKRPIKSLSGKDYSIMTEAKKAGIMVMGVPPQKLEPFDSIMHTSQLEDGEKVAKMACDFIEARYPDAADGSVETAIVGSPSSSVGMYLRDQGYSTITDICPKVNLVSHLDISGGSLPVGQDAAENVLTANPDVKVFLAQSTAHAQGIANAIKALPGVELADYGVFAGDMDPSVIEMVTSCEDPYKGFVAIGGTALDVATYEQIKKMLQGVEHPDIINDALEPITCDFSTLAP